MRICHVAAELLPVPPTKGGAIERWIRDAAGRLVRRGHEVHVVSRDHGDGARSMTEAGVQYHFVNIPPRLDTGLPAAVARGLFYYRRARSIVSSIMPDVVHHHSRPAGLWLCGGPWRSVISLHSMDYGWGFGYRGWDRPLFTRGLQSASRVLCVSNFIRQHTVERYPSIAALATTVYNGVDADTFTPRESSEGGQPTVLYVGRVEERKGVHVLLDAFERLISPRVPGARLRIVGPASYWKRGDNGYYDTLSQRCAANPRIDLRGPTYDDGELSEIYRSATVAVVPSTFPEALGLTSLEAQASGVPVVVSDAGGLPETVAPGRSGLVFANRNVEQLGELVVDVLGNQERRRSMALAAREWATTTFSWDVIAARLESEYGRVTGTPAHGTAPLRQGYRGQA